jgi:hypothetical protein
VLTDRATPQPALGILIAIIVLLAGASCARAQKAPASRAQSTRAPGAPAEQALVSAEQPVEVPGAQPRQTSTGREQPADQIVSREQLADYIDRAARAWEAYTTPDGRVVDPLDSADTGDNYGVIMLADVMLRAAADQGSSSNEDVALAQTGVRIVDSAMTLPVPNDPFNLLAIASLLHDGQHGEFPPEAWAQLDGPVSHWASEIQTPTGINCLTEPGCYSNWLLVWSAGASRLLGDDIQGEAGSLVANSTSTEAQIETDLLMAAAYAGAPLQSRPFLGVARELSDPGTEPPSYHLFSSFMLEATAEADPGAITEGIVELRNQAARYALDMMAPDGQLSLSGRSLDQSWVQAAAAALAVRRAEEDPADADIWHSYGDRALSYLLTAYPIRLGGIPTIVPGLGVEWNRSIVDGYAAFNQYGGLTLWFLSEALDRWPPTSAPRAPLPADDSKLLVDDLGSSGLVWGRAANVWWEISGHSRGSDPRSAQGLVAIKLQSTSGWRDLLALRPRQHGLSSAWTLTLAHGASATPTFTSVRGDGHRVVLYGSYRRADGHVVAGTTWILTTTAQGIRLRMSMPAHTTLHTTIWLNKGNPRLLARSAVTTIHSCTVTASGRACPVSLRWVHERGAEFEVAG